MEDFLHYLDVHFNGILMLIILVLFVLLIFNRLAWIFEIGRYKKKSIEGKVINDTIDKTGLTNENRSSYVITTFFVNIINDFKHLLALIIIILFAGLIIFSMAMGDNFKEKMDALKLVIASLGSLIASIIGYYFGESSAKKSNANRAVNEKITSELEPEASEMAPAPMRGQSPNTPTN